MSSLGLTAARKRKEEASNRFLAALHNERDKDKELLTSKEKDRRQRPLVVAGKQHNGKREAAGDAWGLNGSSEKVMVMEFPDHTKWRKAVESVGQQGGQERLLGLAKTLARWNMKYDANGV